jgi:quercetin dioxygenase-like cupin family protein
MTKKLALVAAVVALGLPGAVLAEKEAAKSEKGGAKKGIVQKTASDLEWHEMVPGMPVQASNVWKGPGGANCGFVKFPKGTVVPLHSHSHDLNSIVIAGQLGSQVEGAPDALVGPGAYQFVPGNLKHTTKCGEAEDCVVFTCASGPFDIKGLPKAKAPAPAK